MSNQYQGFRRLANTTFDQILLIYLVVVFNLTNASNLLFGFSGCVNDVRVGQGHDLRPPG